MLIGSYTRWSGSPIEIMKTARAGKVSELLVAWSDGDMGAREALVPLVQRELRRRAAAYLRRERREHTLQPTAVLNETYVRLLGQQRAS